MSGSTGKYTPKTSSYEKPQEKNVTVGSRSSFQERSIRKMADSLETNKQNKQTTKRTYPMVRPPAPPPMVYVFCRYLE